MAPTAARAQREKAAAHLPEPKEGLATVTQAAALHVVACQVVVERALIASGDRLLPGQIEWRGSFSCEKLIAFDEAVLALPDVGTFRIAITEREQAPRVEPTYLYEFVGIGLAPL